MKDRVGFTYLGRGRMRLRWLNHFMFHYYNLWYCSYLQQDIGRLYIDVLVGVIELKIQRYLAQVC